MKRALSGGLLAVLTVSVAGCSALGLTRPPDVTLVDLEFTDLTVFETTGEFTIRLSNENPDPLTIHGGVFSLFLNGAKVGRGLTSDVIEVPGLGSATHAVTLYVSNLALAARLASLLEQPSLDYRIKAKLRLAVPYGTRRLTTEHSGHFSFDGKRGRERLTPDSLKVGTGGESGNILQDASHSGAYDASGLAKPRED